MPAPLSHTRAYGRVTPLHSTHSAARSHIVTTGSYDADVPLDGIKISQGLDIHVEERDDRSQRSDASTKNLTALPNQPGWKGRSDWMEGCRAVCVALKPGSRGGSRSRSRDKKVESGDSSV